jgi:hypothetical protein
MPNLRKFSTMRERPVLMNGAMVRAVLDGRKMQTRRLVKLPPAPNHLGEWKPDTFGGTDARGREHPEQPCIWHTRTGHCIACPLGAVGDRLWVKETWQHYDWSEDGEPCLRYAADCATIWPAVPDDATAEQLHDRWIALSDPANYRIDNAARDRRWRPAIHMPRWASRLMLEITDVRVQRLQDISREDAKAEGVDPAIVGGIRGACYREAFAQLWDSVNGADAWDANPWVWAITFRKAP